MLQLWQKRTPKPDVPIECRKRSYCDIYNVELLSDCDVELSDTLM